MHMLLVSPLVMMVIVMPIVVFPVARIVKRTGHSWLWALLMFIPLVNFIGLWVLAFAKWPAVDDRKQVGT